MLPATPKPRHTKGLLRSQEMRLVNAKYDFLPECVAIMFYWLHLYYSLRPAIQCGAIIVIMLFTPPNYVLDCSLYKKVNNALLSRWR